MDHAKARIDVRRWYEEYVRSFHRNDIDFMRNINLKYDHTERVVIEARGIADSLALSTREVDLLIISACLHDVGRFKQLELYNTFSDKDSVNHAELSQKIVEESGVLRYLKEAEQTVVFDAISNHNRIRVPKGLKDTSDLALRVVRDADKIDTLRILSHHYNDKSEDKNRTIELNLPDTDVVDKAIFHSLSKREIVKVKGLQSVTELKLLQLSWLFDINYLWTFQLLEKRAYIKKIIGTLPEDVKSHPAVLGLLDFQAEKALEAKVSGLKGR